MPDISTSTPREEYTIAGKQFQVPLPYVAGMVLTANEAGALNQTWAENIRNNFAKTVNEAVEAGSFDQDVFQSKLDEYVDGYEFGVRSGGGRIGDPVLAEAMNIARDQVRKAIVKKGAKLKDYSAKDISALAKGVLDRGDSKAEAIKALAKQRVEAAKEIEGDDVDISSLTPSAPEDDAGAKAPRGKKAEATAEA